MDKRENMQPTQIRHIDLKGEKKRFCHREKSFTKCRAAGGTELEKKPAIKPKRKREKEIKNRIVEKVILIGGRECRKKIVR